MRLDEPYQKGYKRLFVLRREVSLGEQAEFYQQILDKINRVQYHYDASFKPRKRRKYLDKRGLPELYTIDLYDWHTNKQGFTDAQRACFERVEYWDPHRHTIRYDYKFARPHLLEIKVLPHIVTTVKEVDISMEKRISFIDDRLRKSNWVYRLDKLKDTGYHYWKWMGKEQLMPTRLKIKLCGIG